ncbi:MAG: AAA family ATPase, partial [Lentisphaeria bacterium]|nr:AAA family ATPase [Lentisphaeria bacterium]
MGNFNYDKKQEHEKAAEKALENGDYGKAFFHTAQAARFTFNLAEQCEGRLRQAYIANAEDLTRIAATLKEWSLNPPANTQEKDVMAAGTSETAVDAGQIRERPSVRLADVAGMEEVKKQIRLRMIAPFKNPEQAKKHGLKVGGGLMLYGPPGTGKTFIARAAAGELDLPFYVITPADIFGKYVGESEGNVRALFGKIRSNPLSVVYFDEMESIFAKRTNEVHETTRKVISILLQELDGIDDTKNPILFLGGTNNPWLIDEAFLRTGRFDKCVYVGLPDKDARRIIVKNAFKNVEIPIADEALEFLICESEGFSGADINGIAEAIRQRAFEEGCNELYTLELFKRCFREYTPAYSQETSAKIAEWENSRNIRRSSGEEESPSSEEPGSTAFAQAGESTPSEETNAPESAGTEAGESVDPDRITFEDIKGLEEAKNIIRDSLIDPVRYPDIFKTLGVIPGTGLLLYGPPGTGKTMFGRAIANELNADFISLTMADLRGKTPLQTVEMISQVFARARACPNGCVLFLDDCEELLSRPGNSKACGISQFLNELDGMKKSGPAVGKGQVFILIATNRPWMIDGAFLRSGRISAAVYVGLP